MGEVSDSGKKTTIKVYVKILFQEHSPVKDIENLIPMGVTLFTLWTLFGIPKGVTAGNDQPDGERLMLNNNCFECHRADVPVIGPSLDAIAQRYQPVDEEKIKVLVNKVIEGGYGNWGVIPMVPYQHLPSPEAEAMVKYILGNYGEKTE